MCDCKKKTLRESIISIMQRYILEKTIHDEFTTEDKEKLRYYDEAAFYKYYQPKFMKIMNSLNISILPLKKGRAYVVNDSDDEILNILQYDKKYKAIKKFLDTENPNMDIFNNVESVQTEIENFHEFAENIKSFCKKNGLTIPDGKKKKMIDNFTIEERYNILRSAITMAHSSLNIRNQIDIIISSPSIDEKDIDRTRHFLDIFLEQQQSTLHRLNQINKDILLKK